MTTASTTIWICVCVLFVALVATSIVWLMWPRILIARNASRWRQHASDVSKALAAGARAQPQTLHAYYINLATSTARRTSMDVMLQKLQATHLLNLVPHRFEAATPASAAAQDLRNNIMSEDTARLLLAGELGCYASHISLYRDIVANATIGDDEFVLVLEDDAALNGPPTHAAAVIHDIMATAPPTVGMVQLGSCYRKFSTAFPLKLSAQVRDMDRDIKTWRRSLQNRCAESTERSLAGGAWAMLLRKRMLREFLASSFLGRYVIDTDLRDFVVDAAHAGRWTGIRLTRPSPQAHMRGLLYNNYNHHSTIQTAKALPPAIAKERHRRFRHV